MISISDRFKYKGKRYIVVEVNDLPGSRGVLCKDIELGINFIFINNELPKHLKMLEIHRLIKFKKLRPISGGERNTRYCYR